MVSYQKNPLIVRQVGELVYVIWSEPQEIPVSHYNINFEIATVYETSCN